MFLRSKLDFLDFFARAKGGEAKKPPELLKFWRLLWPPMRHSIGNAVKGSALASTIASTIAATATATLAAIST